MNRHTEKIHALLYGNRYADIRVTYMSKPYKSSFLYFISASNSRQICLVIEYRMYYYYNYYLRFDYDTIHSVLAVCN